LSTGRARPAPLRRAALALGAAAVALAAFEAVLRLLSPQTLPMEGLLREDPVVGVRHVPGFRGRLRAGAYDVGVAINPRAIAIASTAARGAAFRVLGLGDSFAFGYGVEEPESYLSRLEAMLGDRGVEVIDAGHPSMGPDNEALLLEADGPRLRPGLVVVGIFVGNDVWNVLTGPQRTMVVDGVLRSRPGVLEQWYRPLLPGGRLGSPLRAVPASDALPVPLGRWIRRSHLYRFVSRRYAALRTGDGPRPLTLVDDAPCSPEEPRAPGGLGATAPGWPACRPGARRTMQLAVLLIPPPSRGSAALDRHAPAPACARWTSISIAPAPPRVRRARCRDAAGPRRPGQGGAALYFPSDPHWTPRARDRRRRAVAAAARSACCPEEPGSPARQPNATQLTNTRGRRRSGRGSAARWRPPAAPVSRRLAAEPRPAPARGPRAGRRVELVFAAGRGGDAAGAQLNSRRNAHGRGAGHDTRRRARSCPERQPARRPRPRCSGARVEAGAQSPGAAPVCHPVRSAPAPCWVGKDGQVGS
jgi:hypothetical protein